MDKFITVCPNMFFIVKLFIYTIFSVKKTCNINKTVTIESHLLTIVGILNKN